MAAALAVGVRPARSWTRLTAVEGFRKFLVEHEYPPNLLWLTTDDIVFWGLRYFFWKGDPSERTTAAKQKYEGAIARTIGLAFLAECRSELRSICRIYVPPDEMDAERRMIPKTGLKIAATLDPKQATEVETQLQWRLLKWLVRKSPACRN